MNLSQNTLQLNLDYCHYIFPPVLPPEKGHTQKAQPIKGTGRRSIDKPQKIKLFEKEL